MNNSSLNNPFLVEKYTDDAGNWYRIYSDGWVEQGGIVIAKGEYASTTVNFLKPFNGNYTVLTVGRGNSGNLNANPASNRGCSSLIGGVYEDEKQPTSFTILNNNTEVDWFACGYGAKENV